MPLKYICEFTVRGCGTFPFDMLRYDSCWPRTSDDAINLAFEHPQDLAHYRTTPREIQLIKRCELKSSGPCVDRWASFGWRVTHHRTT